MKKQYQSQTLIILESALFRTTTTILQLPEATILVDPNWLPHEIEEIRNALPPAKPLYLLFTHSDYDHIIGYRAFPETRVIASEAFRDNPGKAKILREIRDFDDEYYIQRNYEIAYPTVDTVIREDGQMLSVGQHRLTFFLSPGHNRDGLFTLIEPTGILIAGDYLSNIEFPFVYHSITDYRESLSKLERLMQDKRIRMLIPGHGDYTDDPAEMVKRLRDARRYLDELENCVKQKKPFELDKYWDQYDFPGILTKFHRENMALAQKELGV